MNDVAERVVHDGSPAAKFLDVGRLRGWHAMPAYKLMQVIHDSATGTKPNQLTGIRSQAAWIGVCHADVCPAIPGNGRRITLSTLATLQGRRRRKLPPLLCRSGD